MAAQIVLFGATGYTGELTARALVARGARPVLAARSRERVAALAADLGGLEARAADVRDPATVRALVGEGDVLVSTVGPFVRFGQPAVEAALAARAHYVDSTGEAPFLRDVFERHGPRAQRAGVGLLTAMGFDYVPGNVAGAIALREAGSAATAVEVGYFADGVAPSGGTRASAAAMTLEPAFRRRGGEVVGERAAAHLATFELGGGRRAAAVSIGSTEALALPRVHPSLRDVDVHLGVFGGASRAMQGVSAVTAAAARVPGLKRGLGAATGHLVKGSTGGPDAAARARASTTVVARALGPGGERLAQVRLEGGDAYDFTARMLAWTAERIAAGALRGSGALGPVDAFGLDAAEAGTAESGLARAG